MEAFYDEVESLEAILMDDVTIVQNSETNLPEMIETTIFPEIGGDIDDQYICLTLQVIPEPGYPDKSPKFNLLKPRGLDDQRLNEIKTACNTKIKESEGPVVFDLIQVIREHLADINLPSGQCVICLYGFKDSDEFTKTECFHYLHSYCLARHLSASRLNWEEEISKLPAWLQKTTEPFQATCPVCREKISNNMDSLRVALPPLELERAPEFHLTDSLKKLQEKMANLFLIQKSRGAIIDIEAEESSVLSIETEDEIERRTAREERKQNAKVNGERYHNLQVEVHENGENQCDDEAENYMPNRKDSSDLQSSSNDGSKASGSATTNRVTVNHSNFAPIVNNAPTRYQPEPANNNNPQQHYNRRHYRGGNRRYHHHREFRDRERHSNSTEEPPVVPQESVPSSSGQKSQKNNGNQNKTGNSHYGNSSNKR